MSKKLLLVAILFGSLIFTSCGGDDNDGISGANETEKTSNKQPFGDIISEGEFVGRNQSISISCENLNLKADEIASVYVDNELVGSISAAIPSFVWNAGVRLGERTIKVKLNDYVKTLKINVIECDLASGIIGDSFEKIKRTLGTKGVANSNNTEIKQLSSGSRATTIITYSFVNEKLVSIESKLTGVISTSTSDLLIPTSLFRSYYDSFKDRFGNPSYTNYSEQQTDAELKSLAVQVLYNGYPVTATFTTQSNHKLDLNFTGSNRISYEIKMNVSK
jgi:hypothetical protein